MIKFLLCPRKLALDLATLQQVAQNNNGLENTHGRSTLPNPESQTSPCRQFCTSMRFIHAHQLAILPPPSHLPHCNCLLFFTGSLRSLLPLSSAKLLTPPLTGSMGLCVLLKREPTWHSRPFAHTKFGNHHQPVNSPSISS